MTRTPQSALDRYKTRRGRADDIVPRRPSRWRWVRLGTLSLVLAATYFLLLPAEPAPIALTYELDLSAAETGALVITIVAEGTLPESLELALPPGFVDDASSGVTISPPAAHALTEGRAAPVPLAVDTTGEGWRVDTRDRQRAGVIYRVDLAAAAGGEQDIRRHISTPLSGGLRAAGFEIFLEPVGLPVESVTVMVHNPESLPVLMPWPAIVRTADAGPSRAVADASLGFGQGFDPAPESVPAPPVGAGGPAAPVTSSLLFHPRNLSDLNNALLACGDLRTLAARADGTVIQLATDRDWLFTDEAALDLVRRVARTEVGFFGSAPSDQITVLLSANDVTGQERFDVYGVHTGSSVLVMLDPDTTWGMVEEQAASVIAHEMFHGWLGEAIPQQDDAMLWFTEGATTWYAARMLTAAGVWTPAHARGILRARLERDYVDNGLLGQITVADAAAEVMASAEQVRYAYAGGVASCMALDEMISGITGRQRPLDLVLRHLYATRDGEPLTRERLEATVKQVTGVDCGPWLDTYVYGKTTLPPIRRMI